MIDQFNHQQWYQKPEPFERHASGSVANRLTVNSTGTYKVIGRLVNLLQWFGKIHYGTQIDKRLVFWESTLYQKLYMFEM